MADQNSQRQSLTETPQENRNAKRQGISPTAIELSKQRQFLKGLDNESKYKYIKLTKKLGDNHQPNLHKARRTQTV